MKVDKKCKKCISDHIKLQEKKLNKFFNTKEEYVKLCEDMAYKIIDKFKDSIPELSRGVGNALQSARCFTEMGIGAYFDKNGITSKLSLGQVHGIYHAISSIYHELFESGVK